VTIRIPKGAVSHPTLCKIADFQYAMMVVGQKTTASKPSEGELKFRDRFGSKYPRLGFFELELERFYFALMKP